MRPITKIAMIGATGMLGIPVAIALKEAGFEVTALVRDPVKARGVLPDGIAVVKADVRDEESLRAGLAGQDALYLNLAIEAGARKADFHTELQGLPNILEAARDANVARIAYVSALVSNTETTRWWVIDVWRNALARIKAAGIPYTIFYPTNFMETLAQRHMLGRFFLMLGRSRHANYWIAGSDFGAQVAQSFARPQATSREFVIQGPEPLTYDEAAARYARSLRPRVPVVRLPLWLVRIGAIFSRQLDFDVRIMETVLKYPETFKAASTWAELGKPTTTLDSFVSHANESYLQRAKMPRSRCKWSWCALLNSGPMATRK